MVKKIGKKNWSKNLSKQIIKKKRQKIRQKNCQKIRQLNSPKEGIRILEFHVTLHFPGVGNPCTLAPLPNFQRRMLNCYFLV